MCDKKTDIDRKATDRFLIRLMLGSQYNKVLNATDEKAIFLSCLRSAWGDAFRHVSKNTWTDSNKTSYIKNLAKKNNIDTSHSVDELLDKYICDVIFSDNGIVYRTFLEFVKAETTEKKVKVITENIKNLCNAFAEVKVIDDKKHPLCFGHFQKLFNMAIKDYVCIYQCREALGIGDDKFSEIINYIQYADCPIDNVILRRLDNIYESEETAENIKNALGACIGELPKNHFADIKWSKEEFIANCYKEIQNAIRDVLSIKYGENKKSNLYFDFENWN